MKVLVFEFITGGGLVGQDLPESLAREGAMMLQALLTELKSVKDIEPVILLDSRCAERDLPANIRVHIIAERQGYRPVLKRLMHDCDVFWPIAPETEGQLTKLANLAANEGITVLLSSPSALKLCESKFATSRHLREHGIDVIETQPLSSHKFADENSWVFKPDDGVGCEGGHVVTSAQDYRVLKQKLEADSYMVQPYLAGPALSLSCLCKHGQAWLLCRNEQSVIIENGQFHLHACKVNALEDSVYDYPALVKKVAQAIPGLWGYIGIDLIETERGPVILEINPRLTTSYVGIQAATGINVAEQVLCLLETEPNLDKTLNQIINVNITMGSH